MVLYNQLKICRLYASNSMSEQRTAGSSDCESSNSNRESSFVENGDFEEAPDAEKAKC